MKLQNTRILLTGAAGGIGSATAKALACHGARLILVDRNTEALSSISKEIGTPDNTVIIGGDLTRADEREKIIATANTAFNGIDVLINNAGLLDFSPFEEEDPAAIDRLIAVNISAPMQLTRLLLPAMLQRGSGRIVNVGSTFGSIGFPYFASYSASKFAIRGFSESLRRELHGTGVGISYIAPRATKTALNTNAVFRMNQALKVAMDTPEVVAKGIISALRTDRDTVYLGWPESLFVRINALLPGIVDKSLHKQLNIMRRFAGNSQ